MIALNKANLSSIGQNIPLPAYDRSQLSPGMVHIGLGNFHRAHQAWYLHRLFEQGLNFDWAIIGAGVRPYDAQMREKMAAQDYLTTLIEVEADGAAAEIIGPMIGYVPVEPNNASLIQQMADPTIRIVALTVTEGGYYIDPASQQFDAQHLDIQHDAENPEYPITAFGAMLAALNIRRTKGLGPFTGLSCDNVRGNGDVLRQTLVSLARMSNPELAGWVEEQCTFPNAMVDCIVPATGEKEVELAKTFGLNDPIPVTHEHFRQWVIEDNFCAGRPAWDKVGVTFSEQVHDYENMKIRILNGGHQLIGQLGDLLGIKTIAECMQNAKIQALFHKIERDEIAPHVKAVPEFSPQDYVALIAKRFANPAIVDTTRRVAFDGSSRHPGFIIPSIRDGLAAGIPVTGLAFISAIWARYCQGVREDDSQIEANDPAWQKLQQQAQQAKQNPQAWLDMQHIYGDLAQAPQFADSFAQWLRQINTQGVQAALDQYLAGG
jgi:mannitol 2-dehydrogenase